MKINEVTDDDGFNSMMNNIVKPVSDKTGYSDMMNKIQQDKIRQPSTQGNHPFILKNPFDNSIGIAITPDISADEFDNIWNEHSNEDIEEEFGYNGPFYTINDDGVDIIQHDDALAMKLHRLKKIKTMQVHDYFELINRFTDSDE